MSSKKQGGRYLKGISSFRVTKEFDSLVVAEYLSALDCPRALMVAILFREGEHDQLSKLEFNPANYNSVVDCRDAYAATKFLSKYKGLTLTNDLDEVALAKFQEFEALCKQTNVRFKSLRYDRHTAGRIVWLHSAVIRKIERILGDFSADEFFAAPDWGPGASTLIKRRDASPVKKFQYETGITRDLYDLVPLTMLSEVYPQWAYRLSLSGFPTFQTGNKVITVPKDASTNRVIAVEPGINLWFQKSIGEMIQRRLFRCGIDLRFQSRNQKLAYLGSLTNKIASIDLSSASDSIALSVVEELLPPRWFHLMDACRSHFGTLNGRTVKWEKFSSMGNGFTFQLESLIFYAVAACCAEYLHISSADVSAYGDDVLLPSVCYEIFREIIEFYGFRLNGKKSHYDSPFRESCGAHYFSGVDVKPIYLKDRVESVPAIYRLANAVRRQAHRRNGNYGCDARLRPVFDLLVSKVPRALRLWIPETLGDGGFIVNFDEATPSRARHGIEGYRVQNVVDISKAYEDFTEGYLLASLWKLPEVPCSFYYTRLQQARLLLGLDESPLQEGHTKLQAIAGSLNFGTLEGRNSVPLSGRLRLNLANSLVQQWYDLGPWV